MKAEDVYTLAPEVIDEDMLEAAKGLSAPQYDTTKEQEEDVLANAETLLEIAQRYFRLGAFEMEHKDAARCEAEDHGGWPCCKSAAEFFVLGKYLKKRAKRPVYCAEHRAHNRFYRAEQMVPIYENPANETHAKARCVGCGEVKEICCNSRGPNAVQGSGHVDPTCAACCAHKD